MALGSPQLGAYAVLRALLLTACLLFAAFLLSDSQQWRALQQRQRKNYAHLHGESQGLYDDMGSPSSTILSRKTGFSNAAPASVSSETHRQPARSSNRTVGEHEFRSVDVLNFSEPLLHPPPEVLSLRRLEAGLSAARRFMKKAIKAEKNGSRALRAEQERSEDYVPVGSVYRDATIFHQSYAEMERRFKVFIYPEGEQPLVHNGPCKEIYSTEGRFIQELHHRNPFRTDDPLRAHAFFLPFSVSMMVSYLYDPRAKDMGPLRHFVKDYVQVVASKYPFWNRSSGADHFMLSCHDWAPHISTAHPDLGQRAIRVLCNANRTEGFVPRRDASLPEVNLLGGQVPAALGGPSVKDRPFLAFFAGKDHGPVRPLLYRHWEGRDDDIKVFHQLPPNEKHSYHDYMKRSKFCLCPGGYEVNSPRIVEAIYNDCIPVIIADGFVLPFSDVLDWNAFSVTVLQKDIPDLKSILKAIPESKCAEMQEGVIQARRHFLFNQPRPQPYDLFHMILHSVWLRRLNIRLNYS